MQGLGARTKGQVATPRRIFIVLGLLAAALIVGFRAQSLLTDRARLIEQREAQATTLSQFTATYAQGLYDSSARLAAEVSDHVRDNAPSPQALAAYLAGRTADTSADDYIVVLDRNGRVVAASERGITPGADFGGTQFQARIDGPESQVERVMRSSLTGAVIYPFSQKLFDRGGAFSGFVGVNVRPQGIRATAQREPGDATLTLWRKEGGFIAASFIDFDASGTPIAPLPPGGVGLPGASLSEDKGTIVAATPVSGWPLVAVAAYDLKGVLAPWRREVLETLGLLVLVLLGIGVLVWFGVRTADREQRAKRELEETGKIAEAALKDRDLLMKEVHHRMKNSLLMTSSLLHLQSREFTDPTVRAAFEQTRQRLNSIGLVHEALYSGSSLEEVELVDYAARLVEEISRACAAPERGIEVKTELEPLILAPSQVTPLGLILTEVLTNAFKHAFPAGAKGSILIQVRSANVSEIALTVRDDGPGYRVPSLDHGGGLGSRLILSLADQLGGAVSIANDEGAAFQLIFPKLARSRTAAPAS